VLNKHRSRVPEEKMLRNIIGSKREKKSRRLEKIA
jgi:hypothetical protein